MKKVALVGKPNVGKSSLFNRLSCSKKAIVDSSSGVTRDRNYAICDWIGRKFELIDTGGILNNFNIPFQEAINQQVNIAILEADIILFVVSSKEGINKDDFYVAKILKKYVKNKKIILVLNKAENYNHSIDNLIYSLNFGNFFPISSAHGIGVGNLLDEVVKQIDLLPDTKQTNDFKFCIIGKPNVGKSSLVNALVNDQRVIVSNLPNTTRDSIDCHFKYNKKNYVIIDTAGIRKKGTMAANNIDQAAYVRVQQAIARSNLIILLLDGSNEFTYQDEVIAGLAYKANIPCIIAVNKWDLLKKEDKTRLNIEKLIRKNFNYLSWAPIIFISALKKHKLNDIFKQIESIINKLNIKIKSSAINEVISKSLFLNPPPMFKGNRINILHGTQIKSQIPTFVLFTNDPKYLHFSYARYIENQIRLAFDLNNIPITIYYKDKNSRIRKE